MQCYAIFLEALINFVRWINTSNRELWGKNDYASKFNIFSQIFYAMMSVRSLVYFNPTNISQIPRFIRKNYFGTALLGCMAPNVANPSPPVGMTEAWRRHSVDTVPTSLRDKEEPLMPELDSSLKRLPSSPQALPTGSIGSTPPGMQIANRWKFYLSSQCFCSK